MGKNQCKEQTREFMYLSSLEYSPRRSSSKFVSNPISLGMEVISLFSGGSRKKMVARKVLALWIRRCFDHRLFLAAKAVGVGASDSPRLSSSKFVSNPISLGMEVISLFSGGSRKKMVARRVLAMWIRRCLDHRLFLATKAVGVGAGDSPRLSFFKFERRPISLGMDASRLPSREREREREREGRI